MNSKPPKRPHGLIVAGALVGAMVGYLLDVLGFGVDVYSQTIGAAAVGAVLGALTDVACGRFRAIGALLYGAFFGGLVVAGTAFCTILPAVYEEWLVLDVSLDLLLEIESHVVFWILTTMMGAITAAGVSVAFCAIAGDSRTALRGLAVVLVGHTLMVIALMFANSQGVTLSLPLTPTLARLGFCVIAMSGGIGAAFLCTLLVLPWMMVEGYRHMHDEALVSAAQHAAVASQPQIEEPAPPSATREEKAAILLRMAQRSNESQ